jgi:hypothetical protein
MVCNAQKPDGTKSSWNATVFYIYLLPHRCRILRHNAGVHGMSVLFAPTSPQTSTSARSERITATWTLPASTPPGASSVAAETVGWETASSVWVSRPYAERQNPRTSTDHRDHPHGHGMEPVSAVHIKNHMTTRDFKTYVNVVPTCRSTPRKTFDRWSDLNCPGPYFLNS